MRQAALQHPVVKLGIFMGLFAVFTIIFLYSMNLNENGTAHSFDELFRQLDIKPIFTHFNTIDPLYYHQKGTQTTWGLNILGQFSPDTALIIESSPFQLELPEAEITYEDHCPISSFSFMIPMPPAPIAETFKFEPVGANSLKSKIEDNIIFFHGTKEQYHFKLYILGKSNYFILTIIRPR